jgi:chemotaxis protein methyltransferase CheR
MTLTTNEFQVIQELLRRHTGNQLEGGREDLVEARLGRIAQDLNMGSVRELITHLNDKPSSIVHQKVAEALLVHETSFFRDVHPFESLREAIIPYLIDALKHKKRMRIWSAACATGQEPYSIAMTIREHFPQLADWDIQIMATDIAPYALDRAKKGTYNQQEVNRGLPMPLLLKYFTQQGRDWQVNQDIRNMIRFVSLNLLGAWPSNTMGEFDLVFLRNVLIYFSTEDKNAILNRVIKVLAPHGMLFLGTSEMTVRSATPLEPVTVGRTVYYRQA